MIITKLTLDICDGVAPTTLISIQARWGEFASQVEYQICQKSADFKRTLCWHLEFQDDVDGLSFALAEVDLCRHVALPRSADMVVGRLDHAGIKQSVLCSVCNCRKLHFYPDRVEWHEEGQAAKGECMAKAIAQELFRRHGSI